MARRCQICERGSNRAVSRSHSNIATKREQHVNLQIRKIDGKKVKACTKCIKTMTKKERLPAVK